MLSCVTVGGSSRHRADEEPPGGGEHTCFLRDHTTAAIGRGRAARRRRVERIGRFVGFQEEIGSGVDVVHNLSNDLAGAFGRFHRRYNAFQYGDLQLQLL
jgi:hypothetical protein